MRRFAENRLSYAVLCLSYTILMPGKNKTNRKASVFYAGSAFPLFGKSKKIRDPFFRIAQCRLVISGIFPGKIM